MSELTNFLPKTNIYQINKDILSVENGIICQQVNCMGVMGAGLAKKIAQKYPIVKKEYEMITILGEATIHLLGLTTVAR
jgi:O-acetyl-ADP-ribose deacetylase (regulator of RNase III)